MILHEISMLETKAVLRRFELSVCGRYREAGGVRVKEVIIIISRPPRTTNQPQFVKIECELFVLSLSSVQSFAKKKSESRRIQRKERRRSKSWKIFDLILIQH